MKKTFPESHPIRPLAPAWGTRNDQSISRSIVASGGTGLPGWTRIWVPFTE